MPDNPSRRARARELRRHMTPAETILWRHLRSRRFADFKFRRQHPIGPYFADMACHECNMILEIDGETHLTRQRADQGRTDYLQAQGWFVLRFWNTEVFDELDAVLEAIYRACVERKPPPHPQPLSPEAGERGGRAPPHPQPLSPEAGARGESDW